ncbi:DUF1566 domain-containing protein [Vibrio sp. D404a]|uniref:Lcl domain-containing protein n=1 Tax=unclassified Vibrio TaxID=2614977 RepID=UPI002555B478|nr:MULTISPECIES: DUF1566 domain-containing protein [unclassified Vibrio]MDK9740155.1 DUF1566 domain-containing protein [Vibrio sp. D404a]MDK9799278.1 DUF1566 domain-containing protein [Vibrio sp. D449a]
MDRYKPSWPLNAVSVILLASLFTGCQSGHEDSGDSTTPTDPTEPQVVEIDIPTSVTFSEPSSGSNTEYITVTLTSALANDLTLSLNTSDLTTRSTGTFKNYEPLSAQTFVITAGITQASLPLDITHNNLYESNKILTYTISADSSDSYQIGNAQASVTISDSDTEPTISFRDASKTVLEGDNAQSYIDLSNYSYEDVTVTLEQTGIASENDFTSNLSTLTVTISAEELSHLVQVDAVQDGLSEGGESVTYTMMNSGNTTIDSSNNTLSFYIPGDKQINDTGFATYSNGSDHTLASAPDGFTNQDADYGLDTTDGNDHSDGEHGFKFTKLDYSGNILANDAADWACVRDERTGVYIEAKQNPIDLPSQADIDTWLEAYADDPDNNAYPWTSESGTWRSSAYRYTWYDSSSTSNANAPGHKNDELLADGPISSMCAYSTVSSGNRRCDAEGYLANLNSFSVCGINTWRLPSPVEVRSIVNYSVGTEAPTTENYFPYMKGANVGDSATTIYTHSSSVAGTGSAWCMDTQTGQVKLCNKGTYQGIIAVSGGVE